MAASVVETQPRWIASDLRRLPAEERDAILVAAAVLAEVEYRKNPELIASEAFGEQDLHVDSCDAQPR